MASPEARTCSTISRTRLGKSGEPQWQNRGGHRLWVAPEQALSKALDNGPVEIVAEDLRLLIRQPTEPESGMEKEIEIVLAPQGTGVTVRHRVTNRNPWPVRFAPWALSVMRPGGTAIAALPPRFRHDERLLPTNPLVMWGYTDFSDPRWRFTRRFVLLRQDPAATAPQKTGLFAEHAWAAYSVNDELFVKQRARALRTRSILITDARSRSLPTRTCWRSRLWARCAWSSRALPWSILRSGVCTAYPTLRRPPTTSSPKYSRRPPSRRSDI